MTALQQINDIINHFTRRKCDDEKDKNNEDPSKIYNDFVEERNGKKNAKETQEMKKQMNETGLGIEGIEISPELVEQLTKILPLILCESKPYEERSDAYKAAKYLYETKYKHLYESNK